MELQRDIHKIKMVIFDLDDTFWKGTLSSNEKIEMISQNIELVKTLVDRGIMCSICSKNDLAPVREKLVNAGIWDLFIFPVINWNPKGPQIEQLIKRAQLRAENVLFVDDNHLNLEEACYYCPDLKIAGPDVLRDLLNAECVKGKNDSSHSRLKQYKILEEKEVAKADYADNKAFLKDSNIQVDVISATLADKDRILELVNRTNQLNFTKKRIDEISLIALLEDKGVQNAIVSVKDRFGDYGVVGFYSLNVKSKVLEHFLFSCRIMNLGVEQYIYAKLKFPSVDIVEPVSAKLDNKSCPSYINSKKSVKKSKSTGIPKTKVLLLGNCDMEATAHYARGISDKIDVRHYIDVAQNTGLQVRYDSIWKIRNAIEMPYENRQYLMKTHKFIVESSFRNRAIYDDYDVLIFSVLNDYMVPIYRDKQTGEIITPTTSYATNIFTADIEDVLKEFEKNSIRNISREDIELYQSNLVELRYMSQEDFVSNLEYLVQKIKKPIIFLNGPEIDSFDICKRFKFYNEILDKFIGEHDNCYLLDVRKYVKSKEDTTDVPTHYHRMTYVNLAKDIFDLVCDITNQKIEIPKWKIYLQGWKRMFTKAKIKEFRRKFFEIKLSKKKVKITLFGIKFLCKDRMLAN